jgi:hypothetical protein
MAWIGRLVEARRMVQRMRDTTPAASADWATMTRPPK